MMMKIEMIVTKTHAQESALASARATARASARALARALARADGRTHARTHTRRPTVPSIFARLLAYTPRPNENLLTFEASSMV